MGLFQNTGARTQARPGELRLSLAAFGKHPGWDDHISGIGVETDVLAHIKQSLYVGGIGRQIDLGAWEKLDPEKRVAGFDHTFIWFRAGHVVLGRFWSSMDRKGRSKYPMVLCIDTEGVTPGNLLANGGAELERLREKCRTTTSADQVTTECGAAQDRLRALLEGSAQPTSEVETEQKQRFLESSALGPDRMGLLRVVHELDNALGVSSGGRGSGAAAMANLHPYHIRVPLSVGPPGKALLVWAEFLRSALPHAVPLMLIVRNGVDWIDVIVGEPSGDDYFCLQASPQALPLATEIPYELGPDLKMRLQEMEARFVMVESAANTGGTIFIKKPSPSPATPVGADNGKTASPQPKRKGWLWLVLGVVVVGAAAGAWLLLSGQHGAVAPPVVKPVADKAQPASQNSNQISNFLVEGRRAMADKDYSRAAQQFDQALRLRPDDGEIKGLLAKAQEQSAAAKLDGDFSAALGAGQQAFDSGQYDEAQTQLKKAQALKPGDPRSLELLARVTQKQKLEQDYQQAIAAARDALAGKKLDAAQAQANLALKTKPGDAVTMQLLSQIQQEKKSQEEAAKKEQDYQQMLTAGQQALVVKNYDEAIRQANLALKLRPGDPASADLLSRVQGEKQREQLAAKKEQDYQNYLVAGRQALAGKQYDEAVHQATLALGLRPGDATAAQLMAQAQQEKGLQEQAVLAAKKPDETPPQTSPVSAVKTNISQQTPPANDAANQNPGIEKYDMVLRNLMIQLHVKPQGTNVLTNGGTAKPLLRGFLPADSIDQYTKEVDSLRKIYQDHQWLDSERKNDLKRLTDAILDWNQ